MNFDPRVVRMVERDARIKALFVRAMGMQAENKLREKQDASPAYAEYDFNEIAEEIERHAKYLDGLARS